MRAVVANCRIIALTFALAGVVGSAVAQTPRAGSRVGYPASGLKVRAAQFEEIVPAPAAELAAPSLNQAIGEVIAESSGIPATPIVGDGVVPSAPLLEGPIIQGGDIMGAPVVEGSAPIFESQPIVESQVLDPIFDTGQPYDLPIGDIVPDATEVYSTNKWFRGGTWYSRQEFMMLLRTDLSPTHLAVDPTNAPVILLPNIQDPFVVNSLSSQDGDFTYEAGTRLTLGKTLGRDVANRDHSIEFNFMGLFEYTGRASIEPSNPELAQQGLRTLLGSEEVGFSNPTVGTFIGFPVINDIDGFTSSSRQEFLYTADFNSFEANYVIGGRPARDRLVMQPDGRWSRFATPSKVRGFYVGMRYIRQNESFRYQGFGNTQIVPVFVEGDGGQITLDAGGAPVIDGPNSPRVAVIDEAGTYRVETDNDLVGLQFGGDVVAKRTDWAFGVNGKVGGLVNFADRNSSLFQRVETDDRIDGLIVTNNPEEDATFNTSSLTETLNDETLTFLGEVNVYVAYYLKPNTSIRFGYNALYLNGVAAALDNTGLVGNVFPKFELTGDSLYHGMNLGFESTW